MEFTGKTFVDRVVLPTRFMDRLLEVLLGIIDIAQPVASEVVLFGSAARNDTGYQSDIDIMVIVLDNLAQERRGLVSLYIASDITDDTVDLVVQVVVRTECFLNSSTDMFSIWYRRDKKVLWRKRMRYFEYLTV